MNGNRNTRARGRLRLRRTRKKARGGGAPSLAPPLPGILRPARSTRLGDQMKARTTGGITAVNARVLRDDDGRLHVLNGMNDQADGAAASTRRDYQASRADALAAGRDAELRQAAAKRSLAGLEGEDAVLAATEARLADLRGIKAFGYAAVLCLLYLITLPYDVAAASGLPIAPELQALAGALLGVLILIAAHLAAHKEQDVEEARGRQHDDPEGHRQVLIQYRAVLCGGIALVVGIGIWRALTFAAEAKATGGVFAGGMWANVVFTVIALVGFFAAYVAGQAYLKLLPLRKIRTERTRNRRARQAQQDVIDTSERIQADAGLTLDFLEQDEAGVIEEIEAWREARGQQFMHDMRVREHRRRQQLKHGEGPAAAPPAMPGNDVAFQRIGPEELAEDATANVTNGGARTNS